MARTRMRTWCSCRFSPRCMIIMLLCLAVLVQLASLTLSSLTWRYHHEVASNQLLSYKNTFQLECVGCITTEFVWTSNSCQLIEINNTSLVGVECSGPGIHQISAAEGHSQNNITSLYIPLRREPYCYTWRTQTEVSYTNTTRQLIVSAWIESTGGSSSVQREEVTNQFYLLGESPWLTSLSPSVELNITDYSFKTLRKEWEFTLSSVETLPTEVLVEVVDSGVQVLGCGVSLHRFSIVTRLFNNSMLSTNSITQNISSNTDLQLIQDSSTLAISILLTDHTGYMSSDDLTTLEQFEIIGVVGEITDAAFTDASLCLLIGGGLHCLPYGSSHLLSPEVSSLPGIINHLTGRTIHTTEGIYNVLIIWSKTADMILASENGGSGFTLPISPEAVHSVNVHPFKRIVSILVTSSSSLAQVVECDLGNMNCSEIGVSFTYSGGNLSAVYGADTFGDQFIWGTTQLYYSPTSDLNLQASEGATATSTDAAAEDSDDEEKRVLLAEENIQQLDESEKDQLSVLDSFTGCPVPDDILIYAIPVCAPYTAIISYKHRVKLVPGTNKRGKAARAALHRFIQSKDSSQREKDLLKSVKDNDLSRYIPGKVKISIPQTQTQRRPHK